MKNKLNYFLIIFSIFIGCEPKREVFTERKNNKIKTEYEYIIFKGDTILDGFYRTYYDNGKLKELTIYRNNQANGLSKLYWNNGNLKGILKYHNGILVSQIGIWDYSGNHLDSLTVVDGRGILKDYFKNGKIKRTTEIKDSIENGKSIEYNENGKIIATKTWVYGKEDGEAMKLEEGNIVRYNYRHGKVNGNYFVYDSLNNLGKFFVVSPNNF